MKMYTKVDREKLSDTTRRYDVQMVMNEQSMFNLSLQKYFLIQLTTDNDMDVTFIDGLINMIDHIQDQTLDQKIFDEDVIFPITDKPADDSEKVVYTDDTPLEKVTDHIFDDTIRTLKSISFKELPLYIYDDSEIVSSYAKYCLRKGDLDLPGFLMYHISKI